MKIVKNIWALIYLLVAIPYLTMTYIMFTVLHFSHPDISTDDMWGINEALNDILVRICNEFENIFW